MKNEMDIRSVTGEKLEAYLWLPDDGNVKAIVQLAHGMSEHINRYDDVANALCSVGFAVVGNTHLGHGDGARLLGYFTKKDGWDALIADVHAIRQAIQAQFSDKPYFLLGHSMGSFVVRTYCLSHEKGLSGVILSGTGHQPMAVVNAGMLVADLQILFGLEKKTGKLLNQLSFGAYNKAFEPARTPYDWLSTDSEQVDRYMADPLCGFPFTVRGYKDLFTGLKRLVPNNLSTMEKDVPVLLFSGAQDPVGGNGAGVRVTAKELTDAGVKDVTVKLYEGGRHEMFNEKDRAQVLSDLIEWLQAHM